MAETLDQYGIAVLFGIVALQAMGVGGLPGKTALVTASILAADGHFELWEVIAVTAVGVTVGGYAGYALARAGGRRVLVGDHAVARGLASPLAIAEQFFAAHGTKAVFLARFFPGLKVVAAPAAGLARMRWSAFALWHALGAVAFALLFGLTGYYAGKGALALVERLGIYALVPLVALAGLAWLVFRFARRRRGVRWFENPLAGNAPRMDVHDLFEQGRGDEDVNVLGSGERVGDGRADALALRQTVVHRLLAPNGEAADALAGILRNHGFDVDVRAPEQRAAEQPDAWRVEARKQTLVDDLGASEQQALVEELTAEHGGEYDGWQPSAA
jgi:membrane protein DedA with SNARE-associated domain